MADSTDRSPNVVEFAFVHGDGTSRDGLANTIIPHNRTRYSQGRIHELRPVGQRLIASGSLISSCRLTCLDVHS
jgi:hypothetical protein